MQEDRTHDIWSEGVKSIMAATKRSLLDYIDAVARQGISQQEKERLERIKARVHNDISQASFNVGVLLITLKSGGDISAFEDDLSRKDKIGKKLNQLFQEKKDENATD